MFWMKYESCHKDKFHVVTMISNPVRYESRYTLYKIFEKQMADAGVNLTTVELQLGDRPFQVTNPGNPRHIQLRGWDELWHKENCLNIGIASLPSDWETVAWIDADVHFVNSNWVDETLQQLQVYQVVQMFETAIDLGPSGKALATHHSFMSRYLSNCALHPETAYHEWHPGFAWAARREAIDGMGQLYERAILGAGDRHMALAFIGKADCSFVHDMQSEYAQDILRFQDRCHNTIRRDVGIVAGTVLHSWHGKKKDRRYFDRWQILINNDYKPHRDVKKDSYGVFQFVDDHTQRSIRLRDEIRHYFRQRNEDSIDLE
jgi:hypothetical protein